MPQYQSDHLRKTCARLKSSSTCRTLRRFGTRLHKTYVVFWDNARAQPGESRSGFPAQALQSPVVTNAVVELVALARLSVFAFTSAVNPVNLAARLGNHHQAPKQRVCLTFFANRRNLPARIYVSFFNLTFSWRQRSNRKTESLHVTLRRPERMKSAVRSPAFRPQAFCVTEWICIRPLRPKGGTTN